MIIVVINDSTASARRSQMMELVVRPAQCCIAHRIVETTESHPASLSYFVIFLFFV